MPSSVGRTPTPDEVVEAYRVAYNTDDMEAVMDLFSEESTLVDHPAALWGGVGDGGNSLTGLEEIRAANVADRATAAPSDAYEFSNVRVDGDTVTWDHTWVGSNLVEWCGNDHRAVISEGVFVTWIYATLPSPCWSECLPQDVFGSDPAPEECRRRDP